MSSYDSFIFLFFFSFLTVFRASAQDPTSYTYHFCPNTTTYTRNSTYFTNLETLLSTLSSRNASYSAGFQSTTVGKAPDKVTGLFLCRGDVTPDFCRVRVEYSVNNTLIRCPNEREVILYYELCMVSYSNQNIISKLRSTNGGYTLSNNNNISSNQVDEFGTLVSSTMNQAALEAANNVRKFYTIKANWNTDQNLHGLVQCTPDLTRQDCLSCLQSSISEMPLYRIGARHYCGVVMQGTSFTRSTQKAPLEIHHLDPRGLFLR